MLEDNKEIIGGITYGKLGRYVSIFKKSNELTKAKKREEDEDVIGMMSLIKIKKN